MSNKEQARTFNRLGAVLGIAAVSAISAPTQAQQQGASSLLEEVVVTARRREESLQETPIAITALSGDDMISSMIEDSRDLARFVPNLGTVSNGLAGGLGDNYVLRGIGTDRVFPDSESGVGIYIDDVFFPRVAANVVDIVELERVEVLRGPQGTLFGRNTTAGAIRYVTRKPTTDEFSGNVRVTTGSFNRLGTIGSINVPLSDNWAGLISFGQDRRDGYIDHERGPGTNGSKDNSTIRGKLRYESDRLTVDIGVTETSTRSDGTPIVILSVSEPGDSRGYFPFAGGYNNAFPGNPWDQSWVSQGEYSIPGSLTHPDFNTMDQTVLEATFDYSINDNLSFRSITASTDLEYEWSMDMDESELPVFTNRFSEHNDVFQQEFQLLGESDRVNWQAGIFIYEEEPTYSQWSAAQVQEAGAPRVRDQFYSTDAWAVFAQGTFAINDQLSLTAGVRYTDEEKDLTSVLTVRPGSPLEGVSASNSATWDATTPMVSLSYQARDNLMLYGSYSEGFRSGGINFNIYQGPNPDLIPNRAILPFDPEDSENLEFGVKWNSEDGAWIVNTALFATELTGQQLGGTIEFPGGFIGQQVNAGDSSMTGIEFEVRGNVTDFFQLRASAAYLDASFDSVGTAVTVITIDSELANAPESSYSIGGTGETPLENGGALGFSFDYTWRDDIQSARNFNNNLTIPDLGLLNASLTYYFPDDQLSVSLQGTNLSDKYYFTFFRNREIGAPFGSTNGIVGRPREVSLSANYRF